ncbi:MAG: hypothetical protein KDK12_01410 [Rhodobacteraceae bacterium]|nr:hypothetical protein [Paracoccaceae bacterium]
MIAGHFGLAAAVKGARPALPLWALMLGTQWLDVVFVPLFALGIERIEPVDGATSAYGGGVIHADYTHSLLGALILSALYGALFVSRHGRQGATVLGLVAFSHWLLGLVVHRPDLPLLPGNALDLPLLGFGLWRWPMVTAALELVLIAGGAFLYWRAMQHLSARVPGGLGRRPALLALLVVAGGIGVIAIGVATPNG